MQLIYPGWQAPAHIGALCTTRYGGISLPPYDDGSGGGGLNLGDHVGDRLTDVERNRAALMTQLPAQPVWLTQVHGANVLDAACAAQGETADAAIVARSGIACAILTADCLPVLLCDVAGGVVGAAHAGWRGLVGGVLENTVAAMRGVGAGDIMAWLGPAIGPARFEVGREVLEAFVERQPQALQAFQSIPGQTGKYLADIYALARLRLQSVGIASIHGGGYCTVAERRFYSYRRDKVTGRMASLIWIKDAS